MFERFSKLASAVAFIVFASTVSISWAANQAIILGLGTSSGLLLERPFKTILIGDPKIVEVIERGDRSVTLQPLNLGATNLIFLDESSIVIANFRILVCKVAVSSTAYGDDPECGHGIAADHPT